MTGSRMYAWAVLVMSTAISVYLKDPSAFAIGVPAGAGLYANKQYQERKTKEINNGHIKES